MRRKKSNWKASYFGGAFSVCLAAHVKDCYDKRNYFGGVLMKRENFIQLDGIAIAELIKNKEVTKEEVLDASFAQLEKVNGRLNAVTYIRKEQAYEESKKENAGVFAGVPIALKDISQTIAGEPSTGGAYLMKDALAQQTANFTKTLLASGVVSIGNSATPEFALKNITESKLHGPTRNPWNENHAPGGSSGGAAALVASGVVPIAGASDGGGSIRIPASFSGLVGLKPTRGRTPVGPGAGRNWQGAAIDFVLTKSVRDSARMLDQLQVVQQQAAFQTPLYTGSYEETAKIPFSKRFKVGFTTESPVGTPVSEDAKQAVLKVVKWLEEQGHHVEEVDNGVDGKRLMRNYFLMNSGEMASLMAQIEGMMGRKITEQDVEVETWLLNYAGQHVSAAEFSNSLASWDVAAAQMAEFHETYDFYITPSAAFGAPKIGELTHSAEREAQLIEQIKGLNPSKQQELIYDMFLPSLTYTPFTQLANLTGQPAISVPVHMTKEDLPIGVQFMAPKGSDETLLQIAHQLEQSDLWVGMKGNPYFG